MPQFTARLAAVRATPSRADDVKTVTRISLEAHDISVDALVEILGDDVRVNLVKAAMPLTPIEQAIDEAEDVETEDQGTNGHDVEVSVGRRRRGTRSSEHAEA